MARILYSDELGDPDLLDWNTGYWVYNALDCCVTREVIDVVEALLSPEQRTVYDFSIGMMAPAFTMMTRGIAINREMRAKVTAELSQTLIRLEHIWNRLTLEIAAEPINWQSTPGLKKLFYSIMRIPEIMEFNYQKREKQVSVGREAMEKLQGYYYAGPLARLILAMRDTKKRLQVVQSGIDADSRMRCSYNVVGTETGRWSSSKNAFGKGTNNQNITDEMREMFEADEGKKLAYLDLEQAESKVVAKVSGDLAYMLACDSGDLHTQVCKLVWPNRAWTGNAKQDKDLAEEVFYRHFSFRDMSKRGGHASNYGGQPSTISHHLKIELAVAKDFNAAYFRAFPGITKWHLRVAQKIATDYFITTLMGRKRFFFGRVRDNSVIKAAIAFEPQSCVGDILNIGLYRIWKAEHDIGHEILAQVHDAVLLQYPEERELEILPQLLELMRVTVPTPNGPLTIPTEAAVGWNWRKVKKNKDGSITNPFGLRKFDGTPDTRQRPPRATASLLDRVLC